MELTTIHSFDTEFSADSIEWCPQTAHQSYFVCGTYQLEDNSSADIMASAPCRRKGRIYLFKFQRTTKELQEMHRLETAAILDMKWLHHQQPTDQKPILATANALGQIEIYTLDDNKLKLCCALELDAENENLLTLSIDWDWRENGVAESSIRRLLASDSKGNITTIAYNAANETMEKQHTWSAHSFEAWICAFDKWDEQRVYTGGDDSFLHAYDLRSYERVLTNKSHIAGVTCLLSHPRREHLLLTGSYDERLRMFDTRRMKQPLGELNLNGGIWRLKSDPLNRNLILAACMYKNFSIVHLDPTLRDLSLVAEYGEHTSICYGADWCLDIDGEPEELYMATCSFYDHKLCVSQVAKKAL